MLIGVLYSVIALLSSILLGATMFVGAISLIFLGKDQLKSNSSYCTLFIELYSIHLLYLK